MYDHQLDTFIAAAELGSFSRAAERQYISAPAVIKQINVLEKRLDVKLFERSPRGAVLTEAGKVLYDEAKDIIRRSNEAEARVRAAAGSRTCFIRLGNSLMNPCKPIVDIWRGISSLHPEFKLRIVPYDDSSKTVLSVLDTLGSDFDLIISPCNSEQWLRRCSFYPLRNVRICCAVSPGHRLEGKRLLELSDLAGEHILMLRKGDSPILDAVRKTLSSQCPGIDIKDTDYYDAEVLNRCAQEGDVLLTLKTWEDIHPLLTTIPVNWEYTMPYGIIYPRSPSREIKKFVDIVKSSVG